MNKKNIFKGLLFTAAFVFAFTAVKPAKLTAFAAESGDEGTTIADINPSGGSLSLDTMPPADETQIDLSLLGGEDDGSLNDAAENAESQISEDSSAKNTTASKEATAATQESESQASKKTDSPKTGDSNRILLLAGIMIVSAIGAFVFAMKNRKKK